MGNAGLEVPKDRAAAAVGAQVAKAQWRFGARFGGSCLGNCRSDQASPSGRRVAPLLLHTTINH